MIEQKIEEIQKSLDNCPWQGSFSDYHRTYFDECIRHVKNDGLWLEFGVYRGRSIDYISRKTDKKVYGFDSFEGLHEHWDSENPKGVYSLSGVVPDGAIDGENSENPGMYDKSPTRKIKPWNDNIVLVKGFFDNTLPDFLEKNDEDVAFLHIDSDLYSSAKTVLMLLKNRIVNNTIICFDDLMDYNVNSNNEILAFAEFLIDTKLEFEALAYQKFNNSIYRQGCFRILKKD
jgi:hypothetical protein